jgi:hypothetical protein
MVLVPESFQPSCGFSGAHASPKEDKNKSIDMIHYTDDPITNNMIQTLQSRLIDAEGILRAIVDVAKRNGQVTTDEILSIVVQAEA